MDKQAYTDAQAKVENSNGTLWLWLDPYITPMQGYDLYHLRVGDMPDFRSQDWASYGCEHPWLVTKVAPGQWALTDLWLGMSSVVPADTLYDMVVLVSRGPDNLMPGVLGGQYQG